MKRTYELWLDESGKFKDQAQLKGTNFNASLIGGLLIEKEKLETIDLSAVLTQQQNHAMEMPQEQKREYVLPVLEQMKALGAVQVFFENTEYEDGPSSRQLYLRMMAEGLLQLMQTLNAKEESVSLEVLIAQRQDMDAAPANRRIGESEYLAALKRCIDVKRKGHQIFLHEDSKIQFIIYPAHGEQKLQLADFACNTRLTRDSNAFSQCRERVEELHKDAYLFALSEVGTMNYIKRCLVQNDIADALMELYLARDTENHKDMLHLILDRVEKTNYRLMKSQLNQFALELISYVDMQEDYEIGESVLRKIVRELVPLLKQKKQPYEHLQITVLLQLADLYLKEGDLLNAKKTLEECEENYQIFGNQLEDFLLWYQLVEKQSLLCVNSFDYESAVAIAERLCHVFEVIIKALESNPLIGNRFPNIDSRYYGEALGMKIHAMMFLQRENSQLYETLCSLSDVALKQYPKYEEELEQHRQYRSHIEMEAGNTLSAVRWLLMAKCFHPKNINQETLIKFLDIVCSNDDEIGRQTYLMYYMLILCEGKLQNHPLADEMFTALEKQENLLKDMGLIRTAELQNYQNVALDTVQEPDTGILYHPMEIIYWKYASYLMQCKKEWKAGAYYQKAIALCFKYSEYDAIQITGIGIMAEYSCYLYQVGNRKDARNIFEQMQQRFKKLQKKTLPEATKKFLAEMDLLVKKADKTKGKLDGAALWELSRKITF